VVVLVGGVDVDGWSGCWVEWMLGGVDGWNGCWVEWMLMGLGGSGWYWVAAERTMSEREGTDIAHRDLAV